MSRRYAQLATYAAPARLRNEPWRIVVGLCLGVLAYAVLSQLYFGTIYTIAGTRGPALYDALLRGEGPLAMYLLMGSFGLMIVATGIVLRLLHRRGVLSVLGPLPLFRAQFLRVSCAMLLLGAVVAILPPWDMGGDYVSNMALGRWLILLPLSLLAVLVQVSAEEVVFRGYLQQHLAARYRSALIWMLVPSAAFALGHYMPDDAGENAVPIVLWAGFFGVLMADLTARSGTLGPAIAVHLWNNVAAILLVSLPDDLSGLALYLAPFGMEDAAALAAWLPVDFAMMAVCWLAARLALRR